MHKRRATQPLFPGLIFIILLHWGCRAGSVTPSQISTGHGSPNSSSGSGTTLGSGTSGSDGNTPSVVAPPNSPTSGADNSPAGPLSILAWSSFVPLAMSQGTVNNEQEAYITDGSTITINSNNQLVITARPKGDGNGWLSGRLTGPTLASSKGYIEAQMMTPSAIGTWPAFWLMPKDNKPVWPQGGEIDILEQVDGTPRAVCSTHYGSSPSSTVDTSKSIDMPNLSGAWHTFGCAWDSTHLAFYFDGKKVQTVNFPSGSPFAAQFPNYTTVLNLAMGGTWPQFAKDSIGPQRLYFAYVGQTKSVPSDF